MKKIIATVLAMVMALALCTTAFAVTYGDFYSQDANGNRTKVTVTGGISYTAASKTETDGKITSATRGYYTIGTAPNNKYVEVEAKDATNMLVVDGANKYLKQDSTADTAYVMTGSEVEFSKKCSGITKGSNLGDTKLYVADGKYYKAASTGEVLNMLVDNAVVTVAKTEAVAGTDYIVNPHNFKIVSQSTANGIVTGTVKCEDCGQEGNLTNKKGSIPFGAKSQAGTAQTFGDGLYAYWTEGSTTPSTGTTTKPSPKTFDAGIAMYVGMALTSVAGSAVVIGKKKEF